MDIRLKRDDLIGARPLLALAYFKFHFLTFIEGCVTATALNLGVMHEQVFATLFRGDKAKTFLCIEPLHSTLTHYLPSSYLNITFFDSRSF